MIRNYRAVVAYDGTDYHGFQIQADRPTIQGELERALQRITQEPVRVAGAGRTDAGVHAYGQVASFRTGWPHGSEALQRAVNAVLPWDIALRDVTVADDRFHARFSASSRMYVYNVYHSQVRSPLARRFAQHVMQPLDLAAMNAAAAHLVGEQDLAAFGQPPQGEVTVRRVFRANWQEGRAALCHVEISTEQLLQFEIEANAFLRGMVRRIVGTLLAVGTGFLTVKGFAEVLASREISRAGAPAAACGLCLWQVRYADGALPEEQSTDNDLPSDHR